MLDIVDGFDLDARGREPLASTVAWIGKDPSPVPWGWNLEGYPEDAGSVPAGFLYNFALSTYEKLGFVRDQRIGKHRWVVTLVVEPRSQRL